MQKISLEKSIDDVIKDVAKEVEKHVIGFEKSKGFYEFPTRLIDRLEKEQRWWRYNYKLEQIKKVVNEEWKIPNVKRIFSDAWDRVIQNFKKETVKLI